MECLKYSQLWLEEPEILKQKVCLIPDGGTLVEIGTADGGTARFLYEILKSRDIRIYTIDIAKTFDADRLLKNTTVNVITGNAAEHAKVWRNSQVDFLFIDGDHSFLGIYKDFFSWIPNLKKDSVIAFHDYDPPERGGIAHLGVQIFIDTLINKKILQNVAHEYRFLFCRLNNRNDLHVSIDDFFNTFMKIGESLTCLKEQVFEKSIEHGIELIKDRDIQINSLEASYLVEYLIEEHYELLIKSSKSADDSRRWVEMYFMLEHAYGETYFPYKLKNISPPTDDNGMSIMIAKEHIKLQILKNILQTIVSWIP
jgi:hypothetical protein